MAATRVVELPDLLVTVRELTVAEVRDWVAELEAGASVDPLRSLVFNDCGLDDLTHMCDVSANSLEKFGNSDLEPLRDACKALNPHFFRVRAALAGVARGILAEADSLISTA